VGKGKCGLPNFTASDTFKPVVFKYLNTKQKFSDVQIKVQ